MWSVLAISAITLAALLLRSVIAKEWWEHANYYQVYPRSFMDTDADGVGDLKGIKLKVSYLKELGMNGVWLSPIMASPMKDHGYDISDFRNIDPIFGNMTDFDELLAECKKQGIHLILDFVPNHTSDKHEWFIKSEAGDEAYKDYYIWHPGRPNPAGVQNLPPNNWISEFRFSAWQWSETRKEYYYHAFVKEQPDLNYRNPKVVEEMKEVLRFWLNKGVSGFRVDAVPHLFEVPLTDTNYYDEPLSNACEDTAGYCYHKHIYTLDLPETVEMVYQWRTVLDEFKDEPKLMMTEAYVDLDLLAKYYTNGNVNGSHIPFGFELLPKLTVQTTAKQLKIISENYMNYIPQNYAPNWVLGNHDRNRLGSRLGEARIDLYNVFLQTMPGMAITYQGEEIGMTDVKVSWEQTQDPWACNTNPQIYETVSRDPVRTPFQWSAEKNAGFTTGTTTWLPVGPLYKEVNVAVQEKADKSHLKLFKKLTELRKRPAFQGGFYESGNNLDNDVYAYLRSNNTETFIVVLNMAATEKTLNMSNHFRDIIVHTNVVAASINTNFEDK